MDEPVDVGAFGTLLENGINHLRLDLAGAGGVAHIHQVRSVLGNTNVTAEFAQGGQVGFEFGKFGEPQLDVKSPQPYEHHATHDARDEYRHPAAVGEFEHIGYQKAAFDEHIKSHKSRHPPHIDLFHIEVIAEQNGVHHHRHGDGQSVGCFHFG